MGIAANTQYCSTTGIPFATTIRIGFGVLFILTILLAFLTEPLPNQTSPSIDLLIIATVILAMGFVASILFPNTKKVVLEHNGLLIGKKGELIDLANIKNVRPTTSFMGSLFMHWQFYCIEFRTNTPFGSHIYIYTSSDTNNLATQLLAKIRQAK